MQKNTKMLKFEFSSKKGYKPPVKKTGNIYPFRTSS